MGLFESLLCRDLKLVFVIACGFGGFYLEDFLLPSRINKFVVFLIFLNLIIMQTYILKLAKLSFCTAKPKLYIFAGQGTQEKGMLKDLLQISEAKAQIQKLSQSIGLDFIQISTVDSQNQMNKTKITQPLLVLSQVLRFKYLNEEKLKQNDYMLGHSVGQYSALCIADSIDLQECLRLVNKRGQLMQRHTTESSGMLIVRFSDQNKQKVNKITNQCELSIACYNTPNNYNIAGPITKLQKARSMFRQNKITCLFLPVSSAFHCSMLSTMKQSFKQYLSNINFRQPKASILRNLDTQIYKNRSDIREGLVEHLTNAVQFEQSIKKIDPHIQCIQIGHNKIVKKYIEQTRKKLKENQ